MPKATTMRKAVLVFLLLSCLGATSGAAQADGPSGSSETDRQVTCNHDVGPSLDGVNAGDPAAGGWIFVSPSGVEFCSDDGRPLDGRIIVSTSAYVAADGEDDNPVQQTRGCVRVIGEGPRSTGCGDDGDSTE